MSTRITHYENGHGVKLEIDGFNVPELRDVTVRCPVDGLVEVTADVFATHPFEIDLKTAVVHFHNSSLAESVRELIKYIDTNFGCQRVRDSAEYSRLKSTVLHYGAGEAMMPTWYSLIRPHPRTTLPTRGVRNFVNLQVGQVWMPNDRSAWVRVRQIVNPFTVIVTDAAGWPFKVELTRFWLTGPTGFTRIS